MCDQPNREKTSVELADIFVKNADAYIEQHGVSVVQNKAIKAISRCRTAVLGGHVARCNHCGIEEISYNSCRYRHCPKCQTIKQVQWLENRKTELLPVNYFHVVFTIPHELNSIASYNPLVIYNLLFKAAWSTIDTLGKDKKRLGGSMGMLAFLHTWGQPLSQHIHLHCILPGGALCDVDGQKEFRLSKSGFLFPVKVMSALFGKIFLTLLQQAFTENELTFKGSIAELSEPTKFQELMAILTLKSWNVFAKEPFHGAAGGLAYLARYVSKTAISNERILSFDNENVTFKWRDYSDNNKLKVMTLDVNEFIRRFLSHILPEGFMRVRSFGFLASACKTKNLNLIRALLLGNKKEVYTKNLEEVKEPIPEVDLCSSIDTREKEACTENLEKAKESTIDLIQRILGIDITLCKHCKIGRLEIIRTIPRTTQSLPYLDTS